MIKSQAIMEVSVCVCLSPAVHLMQHTKGRMTVQFVVPLYITS